MGPLKDFQDEVSRMAHGITRDEAIAQGICVCCKLPIEGRIRTDAEAREYQITGMCGPGWDKLFKEDEEDGQ